MSDLSFPVAKNANMHDAGVMARRLGCRLEYKGGKVYLIIPSKEKRNGTSN